MLTINYYTWCLNHLIICSIRIRISISSIRSMSSSRSIRSIDISSFIIMILVVLVLS